MPAREREVPGRSGPVDQTCVRERRERTRGRSKPVDQACAGNGYWVCASIGPPRIAWRKASAPFEGATPGRGDSSRLRNLTQTRLVGRPNIPIATRLPTLYGYQSSGPLPARGEQQDLPSSLKVSPPNVTTSLSLLCCLGQTRESAARENQRGQWSTSSIYAYECSY